MTQDIILDAKIEDTIMALPNAMQRKNPNFRTNQTQNRFSDNRFANRNYGSNDFNRFNRNQGFQNNRFDDRQGFRRFGGNRNQGFQSNRFNDYENDGSSRRNFRPFQTRFKEETSDLI